MLDDKQYDEAQAQIEPLLEQDPHNLYYLDGFYCPDILIGQKNYQQTLDRLQQEYLLRPNNQVVTLNYANAAIKAGSYPQAIHLLRNLLFYKDDNILAYDLLAEAYKQQEEFARYYEARADLFDQMANYPKAIDHFNEALNHNQKHVWSPS